MKRSCKLLKALALLVLLALCLAGCKRSNLSANFSGTIADWQPDPVRQGNNEPSEIVQLDSPAFGPYTGFDVTAWPDDDTLAPQQFFAVDGWFGQIEYSAADGRLLVVRVAHSGANHLTGTYYERHTPGDPLEVDGLEVARWLSNDNCDMATWTKGDFQYLVHSNKQQQPIPDSELQALVRGLACEKTQQAADSAAGASASGASGDTSASGGAA